MADYFYRPGEYMSFLGEEKPRYRDPSLPTMDDLPSEYPEEPRMADGLHSFQAVLLTESFPKPDKWLPHHFFGIDVCIYYDTLHPHRQKRPDWFIAPYAGAMLPGNKKRLSYVTWDETAPVFFVLEILSKKTRKEDLGLTKRDKIYKRIRHDQNLLKKMRTVRPPSKWEVYESMLKLPYYVCFDQDTGTIHAWKYQTNGFVEAELVDGKLPIPEFNVWLRSWYGTVHNCTTHWLRCCRENGEVIPSFIERAEEAEKANSELIAEQEKGRQEQDRAKKAKERAEKARKRAEKDKEKAEALAEHERLERERMVALLLKHGIDPGSA